MIATGLYRMLLGQSNYLIRSDMFLGWNVRGVKRTRGEMYRGEMSRGEMSRGWNVFGVKCHVTTKKELFHFSPTPFPQNSFQIEIQMDN